MIRILLLFLCTLAIVMRLHHSLKLLFRSYVSLSECYLHKNKGGSISDIQRCPTHSSFMEPTLAPVAVEHMTTRATASETLDLLKEHCWLAELYLTDCNCQICISCLVY
ncbi:uncharacterized protein [Coffea arabica]|uniref:Uncharacterized protein isoform X4 n=1 Tax=Coffea arabica TaxID=13443 RepID=A0ABM4V6P9_COFAR